MPLRPHEHILFRRREVLPEHPNGMRFTAFDGAGTELQARVLYSAGGGFVVGADAADSDRIDDDPSSLPYSFRSGAELLAHCADHGLSVSRIMFENERVWRSENEIRAGLLERWRVMQACIERGCGAKGKLPGGLDTPRRAPLWHRDLCSTDDTNNDPLQALEWVSTWAVAVSEENAAGGPVVSSPTNGAAGIIPAVLRYQEQFVPGASEDRVISFLLAAGAIGLLFKRSAAIPAADVGCQGEVGVACSMAAGALAEVSGGSPSQVESAARIGIEHNLGLTCDPVGGLVQIPCIERNAMGAMKAIYAARLALRGDDANSASLDSAIQTMRNAGASMRTTYKTATPGSLSFNALQLPVNVIEC